MVAEDDIETNLVNALVKTAETLSGRLNYRARDVFPVERIVKIDLSGRVTVVTGGTAGIGLAAVRLFLEAGAAVAFCGRDKDKSADVAEVLRADYPRAKIWPRPAMCSINQTSRHLPPL